jgi:8-oxo-dGTP pyrophosphatase MutT (NUDIX family)
MALMQLNEETIESAPRPAASLVLLRDVPVAGGLWRMEVFLMKRHSASKVLGGAYVFPGGKLDADDRALVLSEQLVQSAKELHAQLQEPDQSHEGAAALYVAALREAFEECGVLFVKREQGDKAIDFLQAAKRLNAQVQQGVPFSKALLDLEVLLDTQALVPWSRWITPKTPTVSNQRFDARFFIGMMPKDQTALHDDVETTHSTWISPKEALESYCNKEIELAAPQIMSLIGLSRFVSTAEVLAHAKAQRPPLIEPHSTTIDGVRAVCFPGDALHPVGDKILHGPTRLWFKEGRFEPTGGLGRLLVDF